MCDIYDGFYEKNNREMSDEQVFELLILIKIIVHEYEQ